jgi:hypothetical protein
LDPYIYAIRYPTNNADKSSEKDLDY